MRRWLERQRGHQLAWLLGVVSVVGVAAVLLAMLGSGADQAHRSDRHAARPAPPTKRLYVAPTLDITAPCTRTRPCGDFQRAWELASPGTLVEVAGGRYPAQSLSWRPAARGRPVTFRPAPGAQVTLDGELDIAGSDLTVERMSVRGWTVGEGASHVTLRDIDSRAGMFITSASDVSVIGGSVGPGRNYSPEIKASEGSRVAPRNIRIDGVRFHDWIRTDGVSHVDCLHVMAVDGLVVRNSTFQNCEHFDVLFTMFGLAGSPRHVRIEDNTLSCCRTGYFSLMLADTPGALYRDFLVRGNRTNNSFGVGPNVTDASSRIRFLDNRGAYFNPIQCGLAGVTWDGNQWSSGKPCGPHDTVTPGTFALPR